jgi:putative transposase
MATGRLAGPIRIKTQTILPCAETVPMLLWTLFGLQIQMRKVDGRETLSQPIATNALDLAA